MKTLRSLWIDALEAAVELVHDSNQSAAITLGIEPFEEWEMTIMRHFSKIQSLAEVETLVDTIGASGALNTTLGDAGGTVITERGSQLHWLVNFYIQPLLLDFFNGDINRPLDKEKISSQIDELEEFLGQDSIEYTLLAPLTYLMGPESANVQGCVVRPLSTSETQSFWKLGEHGGMVDRQEVHWWKFCLDLRFSQTKGQPHDNSPQVETVRSIVLALRLLKSGRVGVPLVRLSPTGKVFGVPLGTTLLSPIMPTPFPFGEQYTLSKKDLGPLNQLATRLSSHQIAGTLGSAIRRFNFAYERRRPEDQIVDYWIALESLFLGDVAQELSFRAAIRVAYFVEPRRKYRGPTFDAVKQSYDLRSWIVHGESQSSKNKKKWTHQHISEVTSETEAILRRCLRICVLNKGEPRLTELDESIAKGLAYKPK